MQCRPAHGQEYETDSEEASRVKQLSGMIWFGVYFCWLVLFGFSSIWLQCREFGLERVLVSKGEAEDQVVNPTTVYKAQMTLMVVMEGGEQNHMYFAVRNKIL